MDIDNSELMHMVSNDAMLESVKRDFLAVPMQLENDAKKVLGDAQSVIVTGQTPEGSNLKAWARNERNKRKRSRKRARKSKRKK